MNVNHFEDLWNESEKLLSSDSDISELSQELMLKISLMKSILESEAVDSKEYNEAVSKLFGEVLFSLSKISAKTNVNVFKALLDVVRMNQIDALEEKYQ